EPALNWVGRVFNAVDVDNLQTCARDEKEPYLLCLARVCEEKGQHVAIEVARRTRMRLILAGKVESTPAGREYFEGEIAPFIDGRSVVHIDNVGGADKARLLARATALLAPLQWNEPFGLALVEAMASGTPVIVTPRGAAPELVDDGCTGLFAEDIDDMVEAVQRVGDIDPAVCAREGRRRFAPASMADGYLSLYERVVHGAASAVA
ncbi:MAG TPA: glycosyltransferase, partial [Candidatus Dormibacteraeota bacterium]|nr:glycosyltransferase [Candidatus Dormibacteraeota bacterium]